MLKVANLTNVDVVISASNAKRAITVPANGGVLTYGSPIDVTSELKGLTAGQYTALETQRAGGGSPPLVYYWTDGIPLFAVGTLTVAVNLGGTVAVTPTASTITPIVEARQAVFLGPAAADLVAVYGAALPTSGALATVANSIDYPRKLQVNVVGGSTTGTLTLVGVGVDGEAVTDAISLIGVATTITAKAYRTLTSATVTNLTGAGGTVSIGLGAALGLPTQQTVVTSFSVFAENDNKVNVTVGTQEAASRTVIPTTPANGTLNFTFNYKFTTTPVSPTHTHTLA
jgi:hypothetical protein